MYILVGVENVYMATVVVGEWRRGDGVLMLVIVITHCQSPGVTLLCPHSLYTSCILKQINIIYSHNM